jgi:hypothetical protein
MLIFETEEAANTMSEQAGAGVPDAMTLVGVDVRRVEAHA